MKSDDVVCGCNSVEVQDVLDYIKKNQNSTIDDTLENLKIGTRCGCCLNVGCKRIDIHYSEILNTK
jgi:NAD(P)H-nitrite reductase large subunit